MNATAHSYSNGFATKPTYGRRGNYFDWGRDKTPEKSEALPAHSRPIANPYEAVDLIEQARIVLWQAVVKAIGYKEIIGEAQGNTSTYQECLTLPKVEELYAEGYHEAMEHGGQWSNSFSGIKTYLEDILPNYNIHKLHQKIEAESSDANYDATAYQQDETVYQYHLQIVERTIISLATIESKRHAAQATTSDKTQEATEQYGFIGNEMWDAQKMAQEIGDLSQYHAMLTQNFKAQTQPSLSEEFAPPTAVTINDVPVFGVHVQSNENRPTTQKVATSINQQQETTMTTYTNQQVSIPASAQEKKDAIVIDLHTMQIGTVIHAQDLLENATINLRSGCLVYGELRNCTITCETGAIILAQGSKFSGDARADVVFINGHVADTDTIEAGSSIKTKRISTVTGTKRLAVSETATGRANMFSAQITLNSHEFSGGINKLVLREVPVTA